MKNINVEPRLILDVYMKEIRSVLELAVPAWHSGLTIAQSEDIERVQKVAVSIILSNFENGTSQYSYNSALVILNIDHLSTRRENLCLKFARKSVKSRHSEIFEKKTYMYDTS